MGTRMVSPLIVKVAPRSATQVHSTGEDAMTKHAPSPPAAGPSHVLQRLGRLERETTRLRVLNALLLLVFGILIVGAACWSGSGRRQLTEARPQAGLQVAP